MSVRAYTLTLLALLSACSAHQPPPPSLPGLVTIDKVNECHAVAVGDGELWAVRTKVTDMLVWTYELGRIPLDTNEAAVTSLTVFGVAGFVTRADLEIASDAVWFATPIAFPSQPGLLKIDPASGMTVGKLARRSITLMRAALGDDAVWVTASREDGNELLHVDSETATVSAAIRLHTTALDVALTAGTVWVLHDDATLSRVDATTHRVLGTIRLPDHYTGLASNRDALWLVTTTATNNLPFEGKEATGNVVTIARIDPRNNQIVSNVRVGEGTGADVFIEGRTMWVGYLVAPPPGSEGDPSRLWLAEIDYATNELRRTVPVGYTRDVSARIAVAENDLFVCGSRLWRIPLESLRTQS